MERGEVSSGACVLRRQERVTPRDASGSGEESKQVTSPPYDFGGRNQVFVSHLALHLSGARSISCHRLALVRCLAC